MKFPSSPAHDSTRFRSSFSVPPRRGSLEAEHEFFTTRGQHLPDIVRRLSLSTSPIALRLPKYHAQPEGRPGRDSGEYATGAEDEEIGSDSFLQTRRGMRLIGKNNNPRYQWHRYFKTTEELRQMRKPIREYYERNNYLISEYIYIDRLLDSPLPRRLIEEYNENNPAPTTTGGSSPVWMQDRSALSPGQHLATNGTGTTHADITAQEIARIKRTPRNLYRIPSSSASISSTLPDEEQPLLHDIAAVSESFVDTGDHVVMVAIWINLAANIVLLIAKVVVMTLTSSMSVLASLVDGALDFLSTAIVWTTTNLIMKQDRYRYPVGRRRLEPLGILIFSVIMVSSFFQVALVSFQRLISSDHALIELTPPAIGIMAGTVVVKLLCWIWCRLVKNSSVQALAQDAMTDVIFNIFSIIFPLVGSFTQLWYLDPLGGLLLSLYIMWNWGSTTAEHIPRLTGATASPDERNVLLYMTMRFSKLIEKIQGLQAYHAGDKLIVEVDIVMDEKTSLRDSHDLGESLQYMLESVPTVDRAFVHLDYASWNLPTHMNQQENDL
ncbi:hypothetical protein MPDQ_002814 [Monascus purpureus]|uniref:Cation efflux protein transmembrane domain-containing protein n=1 Tax=Monascus purpureus TaxID=5098 RepID=A0A507R060_MONPU|nr:hypothetical protein MPDQ_002814 [Monascus purpureus]BDD60219.1 hypothetical protein MAP00_005364 [Monascus purpureus]